MTPLLIWIIASIIYAVFFCWYIGFKKVITAAEVDSAMAIYDSHTALTDKQKTHLRHFFSRDDGKDFVMVNLIQLKEPKHESSAKLTTYQRVFLSALIRRAGHPILISQAASGNIENLACHEKNSWTAAGMVRYRSRRDLMEILPATIGSEHHVLKLSALDKTFAFPASPWFIVGGPKPLTPLVIALIATVTQLSVN